jgi:hypothetical protein
MIKDLSNEPPPARMDDPCGLEGSLDTLLCREATDADGRAKARHRSEQGGDTP